MPTDLKADLRRLVELQHELLSLEPSMETADVIRFGYSTHRFKEAAKNTDFTAVLQRLEGLEAEWERLRPFIESDTVVALLKSEKRIAELESENQRLRELLGEDTD